MAKSITRLGNITWRVNDQHKRIVENNARTRALIDGQNRRQLQAERDTIVSHIHKLSPGARKVYLAARLLKIKKHLNTLMANVRPIEGSGKRRDLETLTSNMRKALSWSDIDRDIATQPKVRLPDRRFLNLWNGYDLSQFRAAEEDWRHRRTR